MDECQPLQLGISIVAYAPLSRGHLTGAIKETPGDFRGSTPRFTEANLAANMKLVDAVEAGPYTRPHFGST